jgi:SPP1 family predicted phage head-tail adaptor
MRHRLTIQEPAEQPVNAFNEPNSADDWRHVATCWAEVRPLNAREFFYARQTVADVSHVIRIRYRAGITAKMRGVYAGRVFQFLEPMNTDERRREYVIWAKETAGLKPVPVDVEDG